MKGNLQSRLSELRRTGEIKTGSQLVEKQLTDNSSDLFPGEGKVIETGKGSCYMREIQFPLEHRHGTGKLADILNCHGSELVLPARDKDLNSLNPCDSLFFDIETTGLAGGTGTWAFLIGLGWVDRSHFVLRQYFLRRPAEEKAILSHFAETVADFPALISFNGKQFDLPLIQTRQMLAGFKQTEPQFHLDLLQCARLLWRRRLPSRSLSSLEEALLGVERQNDIPGAEIPAVYFDYLRRGKTNRLKQVFHHNVLDILSMVTLLDKVSSLSAGKTDEHPAEALSLGRLCLDSGEIERGVALLENASKSKDKILAEEAALELSFYYKRLREWEKAAAIWQDIASNDPAEATAYVELAKYYEHRCRDFHSAREVTLQALTFESKDCGYSLYSELHAESLKHRLGRLARKLDSSSKSIS